MFAVAYSRTFAFQCSSRSGILRSRPCFGMAVFNPGCMGVGTAGDVLFRTIFADFRCMGAQNRAFSKPVDSACVFGFKMTAKKLDCTGSLCLGVGQLFHTRYGRLSGWHAKGRISRVLCKRTRGLEGGIGPVHLWVGRARPKRGDFCAARGTKSRRAGLGAPKPCGSCSDGG